MSSWIRVAFDPGQRAIDDVEADLRGVFDDPEIFERDGILVWKATDEVDAQRLTDLGVEASRALVMNVNDTTNSGGGRLYEYVDGEFVLVDAMSGGETYYGRDVIAYMQREHGLVGASK